MLSYSRKLRRRNFLAIIRSTQINHNASALQSCMTGVHFNAFMMHLLVGDLFCPAICHVSKGICGMCFFASPLPPPLPPHSPRVVRFSSTRKGAEIEREQRRGG